MMFPATPWSCRAANSRRSVSWETVAGPAPQRGRWLAVSPRCNKTSHFVTLQPVVTVVMADSYRKSPNEHHKRRQH